MGTARSLGDLLTIVTNHLLAGMILQVPIDTEYLNELTKLTSCGTIMDSPNCVALSCSHENA